MVIKSRNEFTWVVSTTLTFINEGVANRGEWKAPLTETEKLKNTYRRSKLSGLKGQINPHFLFNCFNTLSSLITEDKQTADKFPDELSKAYRYLLRSNENDLSTVESEIKFIQSYCGLLQTRHGNSLPFDVLFNPRYYSHRLPSLSLQLLVENMVRHNSMSKQQPITISIWPVADGYLVVENNLVKKLTRTDSTGTGLYTIRKKYKLLQCDDVKIEEKKGDRFAVNQSLFHP